jgi:hypothetical protein
VILQCLLALMSTKFSHWRRDHHPVFPRMRGYRGAAAAYHGGRKDLHVEMPSGEEPHGLWDNLEQAQGKFPQLFDRP